MLDSRGEGGDYSSDSMPPEPDFTSGSDDKVNVDSVNDELDDEIPF